MSYTIKELTSYDEIVAQKENILVLYAGILRTFPDFKIEDIKLKLPFYLQTGGRITFAIEKETGYAMGCMLCRIDFGIFDHRKILSQDLFFVHPGHPKAAHMLFRDFIDFGKSHANHIITMIGDATNIKARSLERLGFEKLEETYRLEI